MSIAIPTLEDFKRLEKKIEKLLESQSTGMDRKYITKDECFQLFGLKDRTLVELRGKRAIAFTRAGNSYIYNYKSIEKYLENNEIEAL